MFFLWAILFIIVLSILILFSSIKIEVKDLKYIIPKEERTQSNYDYKINIKLYILKFIRILKISITDEKIKKRKINGFIKRLNVVKGKNIFEVKMIDSLKRLSIRLEKIKLKIYLGTEDAAVTAISIGIISTVLGIILKNKTDNLKNAKFETIPIYQDKNILKIYLDGIFKTKMIHIIYIIYVLKKKRRVEENVRTSNRGAYAYSHE